MVGIKKDPKYWFEVSYSKDATDPSQGATVIDVLADTFDDAEVLALECAPEGVELINTQKAGTSENYRLLFGE